MFFQVKMILVVAFLAFVATARGPTFSIGNGGLTIAASDVAVDVAVAFESVDVGLVARDGVSISSASVSVLLDGEILTIVQKESTTTISTTTGAETITITVVPIPFSEWIAHTTIASTTTASATVSATATATAAATAAAQLSTGLASTSSLLIAIGAILSSGASSEHTALLTFAITTSVFFLNANALETSAGSNTMEQATPFQTLTLISYSEVPLGAAVTGSPFKPATHHFFLNTTTRLAEMANATPFYFTTLSESPVFSTASSVTPTDVSTLSSIGYAANASDIFWNQSASGVYTTTSIGTKTSKVTTYITATLYEQTSTPSSVYEITPTITRGTSTSRSRPTRSSRTNTPYNLTKTSSTRTSGNFIYTAYQTLDFSGREPPAPLQTGIPDYEAAGNGNKERTRQAAKASVIVGIAMGVWMAIKYFL